MNQQYSPTYTFIVQVLHVLLNVHANTDTTLIQWIHNVSRIQPAVHTLRAKFN